MWQAEITEKGFSNGQFYAYVVYSNNKDKFQETYTARDISSETWLRDLINTKLGSLENSQANFDKDIKEGIFDKDKLTSTPVDKII